MQLFAPDMPLMIAEFLKERNMLLRGLAHPFAMDVSAGEGRGGQGGMRRDGEAGRGGSSGTGSTPWPRIVFVNTINPIGPSLPEGDP